MLEASCTRQLRKARGSHASRPAKPDQPSKHEWELRVRGGTSEERGAKRAGGKRARCKQDSLSHTPSASQRHRPSKALSIQQTVYGGIAG